MGGTLRGRERHFCHRALVWSFVRSLRLEGGSWVTPKLTTLLRRDVIMGKLKWETPLSVLSQPGRQGAWGLQSGKYRTATTACTRDRTPVWRRDGNHSIQTTMRHDFTEGPESRQIITGVRGDVERRALARSGGHREWRGHRGKQLGASSKS